MGQSLNNLKGIGLMIVSMFCFTLADMYLKLASAFVTSGQIITIIGFGCSLLFWVWMRWRGESVFSWVFIEPAILLRTVGESIGTMFIVLALTYASFTEVTAIIQTLPLLITLVSFLLLKENIGIHRLSAVMLGFLGMLLIVQPGTESFNGHSLLAVLGVIGMTMRDIGSRLANSKHSTVRLAIYGTLAQGVLGLIWMVFENSLPAITQQSASYLLGLVLFAAMGIIFVTQAMRTGEVSALAPFRYTRLVFGLSVGIFVFNDDITGWMLLGCVIIILCGLYIWWREQLKANVSS